MSRSVRAVSAKIPVECSADRDVTASQQSGATTLCADAWKNPRWFVLQTKPGKQGLAIDCIRRELGFPVHQSMRLVRHTKTETVREMLFPGYVFVKFDVANPVWPQIRYLPGVLDLMMATGFRPIPLPQDAVERFIEAGELVAPGATEPRFKPGDLVRIEDGPFGGFSAIVKLSAGKRIDLLIEIMGRSSRVEMDEAALRKQA